MTHKALFASIWFTPICIAALMGAAVAADVPPALPPMPGGAIPSGYLTPAEKVDSLVLLPAPPAPGSGAEARDLEASRRGLALHDGPRWTLAARDADLFGANATATFSCAAGIAIGPQQTPALDRLLRHTMIDFGFSTYGAKNKYQRARPFMANGAPTCTPQAEAMLRKDGSYPSGHSAIGYGWALVLAQLLPDRTSVLVARGRAFGERRRICNVHWLSDVEEGRTVAAATFARLQSAPAFIADLAAARAELATSLPSPPASDCTAEALTLALDGAPR
jgi:acid phosphatase (class A)